MLRGQNRNCLSGRVPLLFIFASGRPSCQCSKNIQQRKVRERDENADAVNQVAGVLQCLRTTPVEGLLALRHAYGDPMLHLCQ